MSHHDIHFPNHLEKENDDSAYDLTEFFNSIGQFRKQLLCHLRSAHGSIPDIKVSSRILLEGHARPANFSIPMGQERHPLVARIIPIVRRAGYRFSNASMVV